MRTGKLKFLLIAMGALFLFACSAGPRYITQSTYRGDEIKFLHYREGTCIVPGETGMLKCSMAADGSLEKCANVSVEFIDEEE